MATFKIVNPSTLAIENSYEADLKNYVYIGRKQAV